MKSMGDILLSMDICILGGKAFNKLELFHRPARDTDILATQKDINTFFQQIKPTKAYSINGKKMYAESSLGIIEADIAHPGSVNEKLLELITNDHGTMKLKHASGWMLFPSLNVQYMLKMSHRYLKNSPHFLKTMQDIHVMRYFDAVIEPQHEEFYKLRMADTYDYPHPNLNTTKNEFFKEDFYVYDHDSIHVAIKNFDKPAYNYFKPDENEVFCSKDMFFACDEIIRLNAVLEEAIVLALERSQIPYDFKPDPKKSFDMALMKVCSSITSGFFREFCWEHYYDIQQLYDPDYVEKFKVAISEGGIKPL